MNNKSTIRDTYVKGLSVINFWVSGLLLMKNQQTRNAVFMLYGRHTQKSLIYEEMYKTNRNQKITINKIRNHINPKNILINLFTKTMPSMLIYRRIKTKVYLTDWHNRLNVVFLNIQPGSGFSSFDPVAFWVRFFLMWLESG